MAQANPIAVAAIQAKTPIGSPLDSAGWEKVPLALRESAQFSARIESMRFLQRVQDRLETAMKLLRRQGEGTDGGEGAFQTREKFVAELQKIAREEGLDPRNFDEVAKLGGLQDPTSVRRLNLIHDIQTENAQEFAKWKMDQDPDVLNAFPAQEFIRVSPRLHPRLDWRQRWIEAGGRIRGGRMVALKTDPVWIELSRFGRPWPPFDYGSGMGLRDISRREAIALGLMEKDERIQPIEKDFNEKIEASVTDLSPKMQSALKRAFEDQVEIKDGVARWIPREGPPPEPPPPLVPRPVPPIVPVEPLPPAAPAAIEASVAEEKVAESTATPGPSIAQKAVVEVPAKKEAARYKQALADIDRVHSDGPLSPIPFNHKILRNSGGTYYSTTDRAVSIGVRRNSPDAEKSLAHEVGHWLDHKGIPSPGKWASASAPELEGFRQAVFNSESYRAIVSSTAYSRKFRDYLLSTHELFARAYSQFITEQSGNAAMSASLERQVQYHWTEKDFAPIRAELLKLFRSLGWMK
jgi:hypothetical protein